MLKRDQRGQGGLRFNSLFVWVALVNSCPWGAGKSKESVQVIHLPVCSVFRLAKTVLKKLSGSNRLSKQKIIQA